MGRSASISTMAGAWRRTPPARLLRSRLRYPGRPRAPQLLIIANRLCNPAVRPPGHLNLYTRASKSRRASVGRGRDGGVQGVRARLYPTRAVLRRGETRRRRDGGGEMRRVHGNPSLLVDGDTVCEGGSRPGTAPCAENASAEPPARQRGGDDERADGASPAPRRKAARRGAKSGGCGLGDDH